MSRATGAQRPTNASVVVRSVGNASTLLFAENVQRLKFHICNPLGNVGVLFVRYGLGASPSNFTLYLSPGDHYESDLYDYCGVITGILDVVGPEDIQTTELT